MSGNNDGPKGLSKVTLGFIGTFLSLLFAFIAKDYLCKAGYIWVIDKESQRSYGEILKTVVDDDIFRRIRVADDNVSIEKNQSKNQPTSNNNAQRMQNLLNKLNATQLIFDFEKE
ncbi:MAG: hypothetical protein K2X39_08645 [Silvanigrellaceae bacterium]|nr:hypothetical protein [Silvanigrellaceae bacterium]